MDYIDLMRKDEPETKNPKWGYRHAPVCNIFNSRHGYPGCARKTKPKWWAIRRRFEDCNTGFCHHCGWRKPPAAIYRALAKQAKKAKS